MSEDPTPPWAVPLVKLVERIDQKLDGLKDWSERNITDHEHRIRSNEQAIATLTMVVDKLARIEERLTAVERKVWAYSGGIAVIVGLIEIIRWNMKG
jgi:hypothetical protein